MTIPGAFGDEVPGEPGPSRLRRAFFLRGGRFTLCLREGGTLELPGVLGSWPGLASSAATRSSSARISAPYSIMAQAREFRASHTQVDSRPATRRELSFGRHFPSPPCNAITTTLAA